MILRADARHIPLRDESVDSIVTDPPYELGFMGKKWDSSGVAYSVDVWAEALRVLKPGGHLLAFGGSRTHHRLFCAVEDAGFEIRDTVCWIFGQGFPKSLDVSKAIDKAAGIWRGRAGAVASENAAMSGGNYERTAKGSGETAAAAAWDGWGTALKPAHEPIVVARKPLIGTVAANVLAHGTGAINVDGCRVEWSGPEDAAAAAAAVGFSKSMARGTVSAPTSLPTIYDKPPYEPENMVGRWPANVIHDGSEEVESLFPDTTSGGTGDKRGGCKFFMGGDKRTEPAYGQPRDSGSAARFFKECMFTEEELCERVNAAGCNSNPSRKQGDSAPSDVQTSERRGDVPPREGPQVTRDSIGNCSECSLYLNHVSSAGNPENTGTTPIIKSPLKLSGCANPATTVFTGGTERTEQKRFVYCPKASKEDREWALRDGGIGALRDGFEKKQRDEGRKEGNPDGDNPRNRGVNKVRNHHPTVKPLNLMRYLCRLVTPPGGIVLDPFAGSGSTLRGAFLEGFKPVGIELDAEYCRIAKGRMNLLTAGLPI